ncbi:MAG: hypothetical protein JSV86_06305 [Gemmatimonadota bacterium]|nr:MAG: hypothetical protein JSV86_06305 [Gemmatimonadota bacterium]
MDALYFQSPSGDVVTPETVRKYKLNLLGSRRQQVPGDGRPPQSGYMNMFARESRISFDVRSFTEDGTPLQIFLEMDFWNTSDSPFFARPRLRHFYGVYGRLLAGRTWGTVSSRTHRVHCLPAPRCGRSPGLRLRFARS